jgi:GNAT superfamily N-acetyltransferase
MVDQLLIRQAFPADSFVVADVLAEAARWLEQSGMPLWRLNEVSPSAIAADVSAGLFFLAEISGDVAATVKFQLEDPLFWPDAPGADAAYIHRLAVRRRYAGTGVSRDMMRWAADRTCSLGRRWLRLDCDAARPRLRHIYESFGFVHHSDRQVGSYFVARYEYDVTRPGA